MKMKERINNLYNKYRNFVLYCLIGFTGVTLDFVSFVFIMKFTPLHYQIANFFSISLGITNNFLLNAFFNFRMKDKFLKRFSSFYLVGLTGIIISAILLFILVDQLNIQEIPAKIFTIFVITIIQYTLNKTISFRKTKEKKV